MSGIRGGGGATNAHTPLNCLLSAAAAAKAWVKQGGGSKEGKSFCGWPCIVLGEKTVILCSGSECCHPSAALLRSARVQRRMPWGGEITKAHPRSPTHPLHTTSLGSHSALSHFSVSVFPPKRRARLKYHSQPASPRKKHRNWHHRLKNFLTPCLFPIICQ